MKTVQSVFAGLSALLTLALLSVVAYLAFVFPKTVALWTEEQQAVSVLQRLMLSASHTCSSFGIVLLPSLLICFLGSMYWLIVTVKRNTANNSMQATPDGAPDG